MKRIDYLTVNETLYKKVLSNGLTVFLLPKQQMKKTFAIFSTNYGSIDSKFIPLGEVEPITVPDGVAHFLEHKLFEKEDKDVFADFSRQGASANAYTSFTKTAYLFSATDHIEQNVITLLDFVQEPYFSDATVEKEKGIIAQEIMMYDDQPNWQLFMGTIKNMFHKHPVNVDIAGTVESIQKITKEDLYTCYNTFYHPENMTLFIAGNFDHESLFQLIEQNQAEKKFPQAQPIERIFPTEPMEVVTKERTIKMPVAMPKCAVGIKTEIKERTPEEFAKHDLIEQMILDFYYAKSGLFYQELYQGELIDHSFGYQSTLEKNFGYCIISSSTIKPETFAHKVKEQLLSIPSLSLSDSDIEVMKNKRIGQFLRSMNSLETIANEYIHYDTYGIDFFELIEFTKRLTKDDFVNFLKDWIHEDRMTVCQMIVEQKGD